MTERQTIEPITREELPARVSALRAQDYRLVQIGATRLPEQFEINYSFDQPGQLLTLRVQAPLADARVPSISPSYWCAVLYENELHDLFNIRVDGLAVDFEGKFYRTTTPFAFGSTKPPAAKPMPAPLARPASAPALAPAGVQ